MKKTIFFRTDSSFLIGSGHVSRCLALAKTLKKINIESIFLCRDIKGNLGSQIEAQGFSTIFLPRLESSNATQDHKTWLGTDWNKDALETIDAIKKIGKEPFIIIVDHYGIESKWESKVASSGYKVFCFDDIPDRHHASQFLLDHNICEDNKYEGLLGADTQSFLGAQYAILRDEFILARKAIPRFEDRSGVLIFMGGSDPANLTEKAILASLEVVKADTPIFAVLGASNPNYTVLWEKFSNDARVVLIPGTMKISDYMLKSRVAIGAGGTTSWERCSLGLPSLVISVAQNQIPIAQQLDKNELGIYLGFKDEVTQANLQKALSEIWNDSSKLQKMSQRCLESVDGLGKYRILSQLNIKGKKIAVVSDKTSWINKYIPSFTSELEALGHTVVWTHDSSTLNENDISLFLSWFQILDAAKLNQSLFNLVVHESELPEGKGWSPFTWQILEGKNKIPVCLIEAELKVDRGRIYDKAYIECDGSELVEELREKQAQASFSICKKFIENFPTSVTQFTMQPEGGSHYPRRKPEDSVLNLDKTIKEQFNLLRVVDNEKYPAYFEYKGEKYLVKISKEGK